MTNLLVLVTPKRIYTFKNKENVYEPLPIKGETDRPYDLSSGSLWAQEYIEDLTERLGESSPKDLQIKAVFTDISLKNRFMSDICRYASVTEGNFDGLVSGIMKKLQADSSLRISEYGINLNGICYKYKNSRTIHKADFSLTAYTVPMKKIAEYL